MSEELATFQQCIDLAKADDARRLRARIQSAVAKMGVEDLIRLAEWVFEERSAQIYDDEGGSWSTPMDPRIQEKVVRILKDRGIYK